MVQKCVRADGKKQGSLVVKVAVVIRNWYLMGAQLEDFLIRIVISLGARDRWWLPSAFLSFPPS